MKLFAAVMMTAICVSPIVYADSQTDNPMPFLPKNQTVADNASQDQQNELKQQVTGRGASGESQSATMDADGRWQAPPSVPGQQPGGPGPDARQGPQQGGPGPDARQGQQQPGGPGSDARQGQQPGGPGSDARQGQQPGGPGFNPDQRPQPNGSFPPPPGAEMHRPGGPGPNGGSMQPNGPGPNMKRPFPGAQAAPADRK